MNSLADLLRAYTDLMWAAAIQFGLLCALAALGITGLAWAIRRARRRAAYRRALTRLDLDAGCDRLRAAISEAQTPGSIAWLRQLYDAPEANRRNARKIR